MVEGSFVRVVFSCDGSDLMRAANAHSPLGCIHLVALPPVDVEAKEEREPRRSLTPARQALTAEDIFPIAEVSRGRMSPPPGDNGVPCLPPSSLQWYVRHSLERIDRVVMRPRTTPSGNAWKFGDGTSSLSPMGSQLMMAAADAA
eukprot:CAMPEP_0118987386 /NCGR_PEP_ID=MMETSP1173-20130426/44074_2 /TAXON_ID=1034831 /ORGANISM="Rhizochromulina marina cf, Strain CCMP1243" /LENGTH=144 /DNA_ID=CAMNT_0006938227 /DNA_START=233 /DNA_END=665 /DNA_ORIENTATION=-